jgi:pimeloyl-ACP methyl ester carboxylesterase
MDTLASGLETPVRWLERGSEWTATAPLVLLHGLTRRMDDWDDTLDVIGTARRALAPTLPLLEPLPEISFELLARWVCRLLDALDIRRAVVGGHSLGGQAALATALAYPERVSGLILTSSSGLSAPDFRCRVPRRPTRAWVRTLLAAAVHDGSLVTPGWIDGVCRTLSDPSTARRTLRWAKVARSHRFDDRLEDIAVPTLLVWGAEDRITPLPDVVCLPGAGPPTTLVVIPRCGHFPMLERPALFAWTVRRWLARHL